jgi:hypothetical protein
MSEPKDKKPKVAKWVVHPPTKVVKTIEVFTVTVPGKSADDPTKRYNFTSHDSQVTADGIVYIPLSTFDQARWAEICKEPV